MFDLRSPFAACLSAVFLLVSASAAMRAEAPGSASLCTEVRQECELPGTALVVGVFVESEVAAVVGAQFTVTYDPEELQFVGIAPGMECDALSPFEVGIFQSVDQSAGKIFYSAGMVSPGPPPATPVAVACITFLPRRLGQSDVCLINDVNPRATLLADGLGNLVPVDNTEDCTTGAGQTGMACTTVNVTETCACTPGGGECAALDEPCRVGVCDAEAGVCRLQAANEGAACDDGEPCTNSDRCSAGTCRGTGCTNPSLCLTRLNCPGPGQLNTVAVVLGEGEPLISAGQFSITYDPTKLELVNVLPGSACDPDSPFEQEVGNKHDAEAGTLFYAAGIGMENSPTNGPAVLACLYFRSLGGGDTEVCSFNGLNPFTTTLADENGQRVNIYNIEACPTEHPFPITSCVEFEFCVIPTVSQWGLVVLVLLIAILGKIYFSTTPVKAA